VREMILYSNLFRDFKPVKRFQNKSDVFEFWSLDNSSSKSILDVLETMYLKFRKPVVQSYSSQVWSVQWRWQLFLRCEGQGRDGYSRQHECDDSRI